MYDNKLQLNKTHLNKQNSVKTKDTSELLSLNKVIKSGQFLTVGLFILCVSCLAIASKLIIYYLVLVEK